MCARLADGQQVWEHLPGGGALYVDRLLPFLCVYRRNPSRRDEGTERLALSEASYLVAPGTARVRRGLRRLVRQIASTAVGQLGSFLILEVWSGDDQDALGSVDQLTGELLLPCPAFRIATRSPDRSGDAVAALEFALQRVRMHSQPARVAIDLGGRSYPPGSTGLLSAAEEAALGCHTLGLEVRPIFRDPATGEVYQHVLRSLCRQVSRAMKKAFFSFALANTSVRPEHYFSLGRSTLPRQVETVDRQLAEVSSQFKFLLAVTPINAERSWREFAAGGYRSTPVFCYRPLDADPLLLKRRLMSIGTERVNDPTLAHVLRQTQFELDRQVTMLGDVGTPRFLPGSVQVFGSVDAGLLELARKILKRLSPQEDEAEEPMLDARAFARLATRELAAYRRRSPTFAARVSVRDDIYSGLLVSGSTLLIGTATRIPTRRAQALLQHEVGTHLLTHHNGQAQPLTLLEVGLAGYDALQEGLGVLAEYLVGGLSRGRLRTLAARVIAVDQLTRETPFAAVFALLVEEFAFEPRAAYTITLRVFRGGGLTKDALYLSGLADVLQYVGRGESLEPVLIGKVALAHVPVIRELLLRGVLRPPLLRPRYLDRRDARERLARITATTTVLDLIPTPSPPLPVRVP